MHSVKDDLDYFNGFGGFTRDGREYVLSLEEGNRPPAPWINVISNPGFGFSVSETGAGSTWAFNSRENKITPWSNDPVCDQSSEAIYIRDNTTGNIITPMSLGRSDRGGYKVRHGFGYSVFHHDEGGLKQELRVFTPRHDPVKVWELELENTSGRNMSLSLTYFVEWVLGVERNQTNPYIVSSFSSKQEYLAAENVYNQIYRQYRGFIFSGDHITGYTGDRQEVFGRGGSVRYPLGLDGALSGATGVGLDSCGAIQTSVRLAPGERRRVVFGLGYSKDDDEIHDICAKYRDSDRTRQEFTSMEAYWEELLGRVQVQTSDQSINIMLNGWLLYQSISCRMYARAAFYQCGGAYGFRDQLQDGMALMYAQPDMLRDQILMASSRQFEEGDVQHWWHPPTGIGVRTRISDDLLWLPYITAFYITATGDYSILEEERPFIRGPVLGDDQHDMMFVPDISETSVSLYEHCKKTIEHVRLGEHGLPLMGGGDWNDGMNEIGIKGQGESVWLAWFLYAVLDHFIPLARFKNDISFSDTLHAMKGALKDSIEKSAWDGQWYLRAFYDDGTKLGSKENDECMIDSISQSWSVLSQAGQRDRSRKAMDAAYKYLVMEEESVSLLLTPPFDKTEKDPGYIKEYYPGIRENGGQYTHAAVWLAIAAAMQGDCKRAYKLFTMLNPINSSKDREAALRYEKEPYVMTADVSYQAPYTGRGGWSWYTGSAGWMYQGLLKHFLGLHKEGDSFFISPCVPEAFGDYTIRYRYKSSTYLIDVRLLTDEAAAQEGSRIKLKDDGMEHHIIIEKGCAKP